MGNRFWYYFRQLFIFLVFRKCKKDFDILNIILVQDICPLKTEIARTVIGFLLYTVRNLDLTKHYITKSSVWRTIFFSPGAKVTVNCMEQKVDKRTSM